MIRHPEITVKLSAVDGDAFSILGHVTKAMKSAGVPDDGGSSSWRRRWPATTTTCSRPA